MNANVCVCFSWRWKTRNCVLKPLLHFQVEELYDAYCIQRRLRDGASKMVAAFNSATGSKEARESLSEANKGYRECTEVGDWSEVSRIQQLCNYGLVLFETLWFFW